MTISVQSDLLNTADSNLNIFANLYFQNLLVAMKTANSTSVTYIESTMTRKEFANFFANKLEPIFTAKNYVVTYFDANDVGKGPIASASVLNGSNIIEPVGLRIDWTQAWV